MDDGADGRHGVYRENLGGYSLSEIWGEDPKPVRKVEAFCGSRACTLDARRAGLSASRADFGVKK